MSEWLWKKARGESYTTGLWQEGAPKFRRFFRIVRADGSEDRVQVPSDAVARAMAGRVTAGGVMPSLYPDPVVVVDESPEPEVVFDPLTIRCPWCLAGVGVPCRTLLGKETDTHKARERTG
jgi:hypothetical protein